MPSRSTQPDAGPRINILGASGSGATTAGRAVAALDVPYLDGDHYFHGLSDPPFSAPRSPADRYRMFMDDLGARPRWGLGGGVAGWDPFPELAFTRVVFLWVRPRFARIRQRERARFGARILPGGGMETIHRDFVAWASRYDAGDVEGKTLARHEVFRARQRCPVVELRGAFPVEHGTAEIRAACERR